MGDGGAAGLNRTRLRSIQAGISMNLWLCAAAIAFACGAWFVWFLSTRPILFTRLFVSQERRLVVRREILEDDQFKYRMRKLSFAQIVLCLGCLGASFFVGDY